jgi:hypothetical protein
MAVEAGNIWKGHTKNVLNLQVHWVPGHVDFAPNEQADEEAKLAAQGNSSNLALLPTALRKGRLRLSITALQHQYLSQLCKCWTCRWKLSPHYKHLRTIDNSAPSRVHSPHSGPGLSSGFITNSASYRPHRSQPSPLPHTKSRITHMLSLSRTYH